MYTHKISEPWVKYSASRQKSNKANTRLYASHAIALLFRTLRDGLDDEQRSLSNWIPSLFRLENQVLYGNHGVVIILV